jgi:hypothetical protein
MLASPLLFGLDREIKLEALELDLVILARSRKLLATAVNASYPDETEVADRIRDGAAFISSRPSFIA